MAIDLKNLSPKELQALIANANAQMHDARVAQVQAVKQKIEALLSNHGLTLHEIYPSRSKKAVGKKGVRGLVAPKYHNPSDPSQTWSGRGRQPVWFSNALKRRGVTVEDLLIDRATRPPTPAENKNAAKKAPEKTAKRAARKATAKKIG
jgi:DNA-binding protein H-NS